MSVFVLIPVFNRLAHTREIIDCLRRQTGVSAQIVIVDDGSTDGTAEYLAGQPEVMRLEGNGQLWWAGAIHLALQTIHPLLQPGDFFVFMNNDTKIADDFLSTLVATSQAHGRAVVGSVVRAAQPPHDLLSIGPKGDLWNMAIWDVARDVPAHERARPRDTYEVDFLPGRGSLYPGEVLNRIGYMRPRLLPHYHADYEFADRARRAGFSLLVASSAVTYSTDTFGNERKAASFWRRKFGKGSPDNFLQKVAFFCLVGSTAQRLSAVPRMLLAQINRGVHQVKILAIRLISMLLRCMPRSLRALLRQHVLSLRNTSLYRRVLTLLTASRSSVARARILAALERRWRRRLAAQHVYASAQLIELQRGKVLLLGPDALHYLPFFRLLRVSAGMLPPDGFLPPKDAGADLVFCTAGGGELSGTLPPSTALVKLVRPGGILYCVSDTVAQAPDDITRLVDELSRMPGLEVLADSRTDPAVPGKCTQLKPSEAFAGARAVDDEAALQRFFAVRRLRRP